MHAANFAVDAELSRIVSAQQNGGPDSGLRAISVHISDETFVLAGTVRGSDDLAADFPGVVRDLLAEDTPAYLLIRAAAGAAGWVLVGFVPDSAPVRPKMLYSSGREALRKGLGGGQLISHEVHWTCLDDARLDALAPPDAEKDSSLLTASERLSIEEDKLTASEAAGDKVSSASLSFPMSGDALASLNAFSDKEVALLILGIEGEQVTVRGQRPSIDIGSLSSALPADVPSYSLYRWSHESDGAARDATLFIYVRPECAPVRAKMLHASSKAAVVQSLGGLGVEIEKSLEARRDRAEMRPQEVAQLLNQHDYPVQVCEPAEVTEDLIRNEVYASTADAAQAAPTVKAAPRGGRRLNKKR